MKIEFGKHVSVSYVLTGYEAPENPEEEIELENIEETTPDRPFQFIFGVGQLIAGFEKNIEGMEEGGSFDFTLSPAEAYGEYKDEEVHYVPIAISDLKQGGFPMEFCKVGSSLPLQNQNGEIMQSEITEVKEKEVICKIDFNAPLAGMTLHFVGKILEVRDATEADKIEYMKQMTGEVSCHCGGGCGGGSCNGNCDSCGEGHCGEEGHCKEGHHKDGHCKKSK
ncbi:MAG: FKBP-type peptidyl-prolyl cis-trans isomerase [Bacteroidales bacterium]|jgi:FKBP-type peptidyl-prolyl cis-trans isomerase SlyD|nr:FKBP-type peptidyl-prolyl cis-trans isomerase [Bacteroidales bacterium]MBP5764350.1 FKBP-type peptidyl-prolyl cis-trans isomerase [Bacteroidales bacterium]